MQARQTISKLQRQWEDLTMDVEQLKKDLVVSEGEEVRHVLAGLHAISTVWQKVRVPRRMFSYNPLRIARSLTYAGEATRYCSQSQRSDHSGIVTVLNFAYPLKPHTIPR